MDECDVLIIGGGTAGATAAYILANAGVNCLIADDPTHFKTHKIGESLLGSAKPILQYLNLLPWVLQSLPQNNYGNLSAWGSDRLISKDYIFSPHGSAWHLDRAQFDTSLRKAAQSVGARFHDGYIKKIHKDGNAWIAGTRDTSFKARWVIDATGRSAFMSKQLSIARHSDQPLIAIYRWGNNNTTDARTLVESTHYGWWYTAPLPNHRRVTSLHIRPADMTSLLANSTGWQTLLSTTRHLSTVCTADDQWSRPQGANATGQWQTQVSGDNWIAIGDAALAFDPLSSQGIFNAIYTAWKASSTIVTIINQGSTKTNAYDNEIRNIRAAYIKNTNEYYNLEQRWPNTSFWAPHHNRKAVTQSI